MSIYEIALVNALNLLLAFLQILLTFIKTNSNGQKLNVKESLASDWVSSKQFFKYLEDNWRMLTGRQLLLETL